jgi:hypothetical protein
MTKESSILEYLAKAGSAKAWEVVKHCDLKDKHEANSLLYRMKNEGKAIIDDDRRWSLGSIGRKSRPQPSSGQSPGSKPAPGRNPAVALPHTTYNGSPAAQQPPTVEKIVWTKEQAEIIDAPPQARVLVEAGPGTGKTAVACARVAKFLREDNVIPSSILMVSFTRTAVAEMKNRIRLWADSGRVNAVNVCTLDQAAFQFGIGCGNKFEKLMGNFDDNIQATLDNLAQKNALLLEYVRGLDHVIIDEAQDLIGPRRELASLLLGALRGDAGATIFADSAQSIFGFTSDVDASGKGKQHFLDSFDARGHGFKPARLSKIHRTASPQILDLFTQSRQILTGPHTADASHVWNVIKAGHDSAPCEGDDVKNLPLEDGDLLLYRKRASALMHAMWCPRLFRLRLPAHPPALFPWLGLVFSNFSEPLVSREQFSSAWKTSVPAEMADGFTADTAWALLHRFAADRAGASLTRLRAKLSLPRPPVEFCQLDYGSVGPIFSTIHASKGREADRVFLMLPRNLDYIEKNGKIDPEEEARVFYVGSTRVRKQFLRGIAQTIAFARRLNNGSERVVQICSEKKSKFQFGLARDFDDLAPISREPFFCASAAAASSHQKGLIALWQKCLADGTAAEVRAVSKNKPDADVWPYQFVDAAERPLAWSAAFLGKDLWKMSRQMEEKFGGNRHPPQSIMHLRMIGLRTRVLGDDPAALGRIHQPFAKSGFWLAPMIVGFQPVFFNKH